MPEAWTVVAYGTAGPQGSKIRTRYGMREASAKVAPWRESVKEAALKARAAGAPTLDGPLAVRIVFTLGRPAAARKRDLHPSTRPDLSKILRSTEDAITDAGLWADDARICDFTRLAKVWAGCDYEALPMPGVIVMCAPIDHVGLVGTAPGRAAAAVECQLYGEVAT